MANDIVNLENQERDITSQIQAISFDPNLRGRQKSGEIDKLQRQLAQVQGSLYSQRLLSKQGIAVQSGATEDQLRQQGLAQDQVDRNIAIQNQNLQQGLRASPILPGQPSTLSGGYSNTKINRGIQEDSELRAQRARASGRGSDALYFSRQAEREAILSKPTVRSDFGSGQLSKRSPALMTSQERKIQFQTVDGQTQTLAQPGNFQARIFGSDKFSGKASTIEGLNVATQNQVFAVGARGELRPGLPGTEINASRELLEGIGQGAQNANIFNTPSPTRGNNGRNLGTQYSSREVIAAINGTNLPSGSGIGQLRDGSASGSLGGSNNPSSAANLDSQTIPSGLRSAPKNTFVEKLRKFSLQQSNPYVRGATGFFAGAVDFVVSPANAGIEQTKETVGLFTNFGRSLAGRPEKLNQQISDLAAKEVEAAQLRASIKEGAVAFTQGQTPRSLQIAEDLKDPSYAGEVLGNIAVGFGAEAALAKAAKVVGTTTKVSSVVDDSVAVSQRATKVTRGVGAEAEFGATPIRLAQKSDVTANVITETKNFFGQTLKKVDEAKKFSLLQKGKGFASESDAVILSRIGIQPKAGAPVQNFGKQAAKVTKRGDDIIAIGEDAVRSNPNYKSLTSQPNAQKSLPSVTEERIRSFSKVQKVDSNLGEVQRRIGVLTREGTSTVTPNKPFFSKSQAKKAFNVPEGRQIGTLYDETLKVGSVDRGPAKRAVRSQRVTTDVTDLYSGEPLFDEVVNTPVDDFSGGFQDNFLGNQESNFGKSGRKFEPILNVERRPGLLSDVEFNARDFTERDAREIINSQKELFGRGRDKSASPIVNAANTDSQSKAKQILGNKPSNVLSQGRESESRGLLLLEDSSQKSRVISNADIAAAAQLNDQTALRAAQRLYNTKVVTPGKALNFGGKLGGALAGLGLGRNIANRSLQRLGQIQKPSTIQRSTPDTFQSPVQSPEALIRQITGPRTTSSTAQSPRQSTRQQTFQRQVPTPFGSATTLPRDLLLPPVFTLPGGSRGGFKEPKVPRFRNPFAGQRLYKVKTGREFLKSVGALRTSVPKFGSTKAVKIFSGKSRRTLF